MSDNEPVFSRRKFGQYMLAAGGVSIMGVSACAQSASANSTEIVVYKTVSCGCCNHWVDYLRDEGYDVIAHDIDTMNRYKASVGVPGHLQSCHTAMIDGYVIEGHVPVKEIERLLLEKPDAIGLSVPGMVSGSPGMENGRFDPYDVILFTKLGDDTVYASY